MCLLLQMVDEFDFEEFDRRMEVSHVVPDDLKEYTHTIRKQEQWHKVKEQFCADVWRFRTMSFDTENKLNLNMVTFVLAGTVTGRVVIFHLSDLDDEREALGKDKAETLKELLPREFIELLEHKEIVKIGSEIYKDALEMLRDGIKFKTNADTQNIFKRFGNILRRFHSADKCGLGFISDVLTDINYKPAWSHRIWFKRIQFLYAWKEENWKFSEGYMRNDALVPCLLVLTLAKRRIERGLSKETSLKGGILELYETMNIIPKRPEPEDEPESNDIEGESRPGSESDEVEIDLHIGKEEAEFEDAESEVEIAESEVEIAESEVEVEQVDTRVRFGGSEGPPHTIKQYEDGSKIPVHEWPEDDLRFRIGNEGGIGERIDPEVETFHESSIGNRSHLTLPNEAVGVNRSHLTLHDQAAKQTCVVPSQILYKDRVGNIRLECQSESEVPVAAKKRKRKPMEHIEPEQLAKTFKACNLRPLSVPNDRRISPTFDQLCMFCGSDEHTMYVPGKRDLVQCPSYQPPRDDLRLCMYKHCDDPGSHTTAVCHRLHDRCHKCKMRGHHESLCDLFTKTEFRDDFEAVADRGVFTARRFGNPNWGFYWIEDDERAAEVKAKRPNILMRLKKGPVSKAIRQLNRCKL